MPLSNRLALLYTIYIMNEEAAYERRFYTVYTHEDRIWP